MSAGPRPCARCGQSYGPNALYCPRDGTPLTGRAPPADDPYLGQLVGGDLTLSALIGLGAMARVYRAHQQSVGRDVAVKLLHPELARDGAALSRFRREARVAGRLDHPNVVTVLTAGTIPPAEDGRPPIPWMALELLDGISLRSALAAGGGHVAIARAVHVLLQLADALGTAHAAGVVHRDVKPENVMLVRRGEDPDFVKLVDFGVARTEAGEDGFATREGSVLGSARYVSPEGARGERATPASDVYSLGVVAFECLAGRGPFEADNPVAVLVQHARDPAPDVRAFAAAAEAPDALARLIARCLEKAPVARPEHGWSFARELREVAVATGLLAPSQPASTGSREGHATQRFTPSAELAARLAGAPRSPPEAGDAAPSPPTASAGRRAGPGGLALVALGCALSAAPARATQPEPPPGAPAPAATRPDTQDGRLAQLGLDERPSGLAEFGVGALTLPGADVCGTRDVTGCVRGDASFALDIRQLYRARPDLAFGAGLTLGLIPSAAPPIADPEGIERDHTRRYFVLEGLARYYALRGRFVEAWVGPAAGLVVVSDRFDGSRSSGPGAALIGPRAVVIRTEGWSVGIAAGASYRMTSHWSVGGAVQLSRWRLPDTAATNVLGDESSITGAALVLQAGLDIAYRVSL
ncbi:MAG: serine/threonine protein kinase [Polyangiaceae bacterium]|nr:serine/threonine protein kinase [Polyangiaceae bacterium]